jgi:transposase-like protein
MDKTEKWTMPIRDWGLIINQMGVYFGERINKHLAG